MTTEKLKIRKIAPWLNRPWKEMPVEQFNASVAEIKKNGDVLDLCVSNRVTTIT